MDEARGIVDALGRVGWAGAVALVALLALVLAVHARASGAARRRRLEAAREARRRALAEYEAALAAGDAEKAMLAKRRLDAARRAGREGGAAALVLPACAALALAGAGCAHRAANPRAVPVGRYLMAPAPGDTVPGLPEGETRWWLMSAPTGFRMLLPEDSLLPTGQEGG